MSNLQFTANSCNGWVRPSNIIPTITSLSNAYSTSSSGIPSASSLSNPSWNSLPLDNTALRQQQQSMILFRNPFSAEEESEYNCDDDEVIEALEPEQKRHRPNL